MNEYYVTMSDGTLDNIDAASAAEAIGLALKAYRGRTVAACYVGNAEGRTDFEIPAHSAIPENQPKAKRAEQFGMFDDKAIKAESERALETMKKL